MKIYDIFHNTHRNTVCRQCLDAANLWRLSVTLCRLPVRQIVAPKKANLAQAEAELRQLLAVQESAPLRDLLGVALDAQGRADEAERELERAVALDPGYAPAHQHLARVRLHQNRLEPALAALRAAAELGPLEREAVDALVRAVFHPSAPHKRIAEALWLRSRGNAGQLAEVLRDALARGDARTFADADERVVVVVDPFKAPKIKAIIDLP